MVHEAMPQIAQPEIARAQTADELKRLIESDPARFKRTQRRQMYVELLDVEYSKQMSSAGGIGLASLMLKQLGKPSEPK